MNKDIQKEIEKGMDEQWSKTKHYLAWKHWVLDLIEQTYNKGKNDAVDYIESEITEMHSKDGLTSASEILKKARNSKE